eukprot:3428151-Rhodomonas_salina.1
MRVEVCFPSSFKFVWNDTFKTACGVRQRDQVPLRETQPSSSGGVHSRTCAVLIERESADVLLQSPVAQRAGTVPPVTFAQLGASSAGGSGSI